MSRDYFLEDKAFIFLEFPGPFFSDIVPICDLILSRVFFFQHRNTPEFSNIIIAMNQPNSFRSSAIVLGLAFDRRSF